MGTGKRTLRVLLAILLAVVTLRAEDWTQWGGSHRNFKASSTGLASSWPSDGPRVVWNRKLGEGYSAIAVEKKRLYTMYREKAGVNAIGKKDQEVVIAMDALDGKTLWEYRYDAPPLPKMDQHLGPGPHSTPLIVGKRIFTVGATGRLHALAKKNGRVLWSRDLYKEFGAFWFLGYSCSPIAYKETVILTTGQKGHSVIAFRQSDGAVVWQKQDFGYSYSSPILINVDGQDQLVVYMSAGPAGLDPSTGDLLWTYPHKTSSGYMNISTPVWGEDNLLFMSSADNGGSSVVHLTRQQGKTNVRELWFTKRFRIQFGDAIRLGDFVYCSIGELGPTFFTAVDVKTGNVAWQDRSFTRASMVYADGKLIVLDEDGNLALVTVSPAGFKVLARAAVLTPNAWTTPTLVGTRLYIRDRATIRALDLK